MDPLPSQTAFPCPCPDELFIFFRLTETKRDFGDVFGKIAWKYHDVSKTVWVNVGGIVSEGIANPFR